MLKEMAFLVKRANSYCVLMRITELNYDFSARIQFPVHPNYIFFYRQFSGTPLSTIHHNNIIIGLHVFKTVFRTSYRLVHRKISKSAHHLIFNYQLNYQRLFICISNTRVLYFATQLNTNNKIKQISREVVQTELKPAN